jgi:hypothetical protein
MNKKILLLKTRFLLIAFFMLFSLISKGQTTLFQFDFEGSNATPNINNTVGTPAISRTTGLNFGYADSNTCNVSNSISLFGNSWATNDFFMFTVNTTGYENLVFSFCNRASSNDINNFTVYSSSDQGATINPISPNFNPGITGGTVVTNTLPASANSNTEVRIYIYKTNNPSGNGNGANSPSIRTLYLDDVTLRGCPTTAGTLSGDQSLCVGGATGTSTFSSTVSGGTWSSSNTGVATVNSMTGLVTAIGGGTATITYTISGSGCTTRTATRTVTISPPITNNNVSYSNGTSMQVNATANEGNNVVLNAPVNTYFATVNFVSYGTPTGTAPNFALGACHSTNSQSVTEGYLLGNTTATIPATNAVFTDPCNGTVKRLYVSATYAQPVCNGSGVTITGTTPLGGTGTFTYQWQSSTTSATAGFAAAAGSNNSINYTSGPLTQTTWFRRVVTSCTSSSTSAIVMVRVNAAVTSGSIGTNQTICSNTIPSPLTSTAIGTGSGTITYEWQTNTSGSYVTITGATGATYSPPVLTATTSYQRRTVSISGGVTCYSPYTTPVTITVAPPSGDQVTYGASSWIGYVYANTDGGNPPGNAFTTTYRGYVTQTENFNYDLGNGSISGPNLCGTYDTNFAVRYKMTRNLPAGCYTFTVGGDDGYRLSLDGGATFVINNWDNHAFEQTTYSTYLSGNVNFVLEYFETGGQSRVQFSSTSTVLSTPVIGTITQPTCVVTTGSVQLSGLPTGSRTIIASPNTAGLTNLTGTGATATIGGLVPGITYTFSVSNTTCTTTVSAPVVVNSLVTTTFNGSTWSSGTGIDKIGIITASSTMPISLSSNTELCNCTVSANTNVVVNSGISLKLQDRLTVNGSLTFRDDASLVQINNVANSGNIIYERETTPIKRFDYTYWSSPVLNQKLIDVSPETDYDKFYSFDAASDNWSTADPQGFMQRGIGYIIRAPEGTNAPPSPLSTYPASFIGVPFNGAFTIPGIIQDRSYLLGNPYPSALDADKFLTANSSVLDGTLYFWTHTTNIGIGVSNPGSGVYAYSSDDYATYNLTGGVGTAGNFIGTVEQTINRPTGKIAAGQAFFTSSQVSVPINSNIVFNNNMRLEVNDAIMDNSQFFKVNNSTKKTNTIEKHRVWLNLTNTQGAFKQMLVGYLTGATNEYDSSFDGPSYNGNEFIDFYSISDGEFLAIQGRALPFDENDSVSIGYSSSIEGDFSISIDEVDGLLVGQNIYLEDKLNNSIHNLTKEAYTFETSKGTFDDRFVLRYTDKTLGTGDFDTTNMQVLVSVKNKQIKINSSVESIDKVLIFDILGKQIFSKINVGTTEFVIPNLGSSEQVLIVKTLLQNGQTVTTKLIY